MKTTAKTAAALVCAVAVLSPVAHAQDGTDWTGGRPLPAGTEVPFEPGYATQWRSYDVVKFGDPRYRDSNVRGVRVLGQFDQDSVLCLMNAKGGMWGCYIDGEKATELSYMPYGKVITNDPVVKFFAPVISFGLRAQLELNNLLYRAGSSRI
ncbi:hypothetical protein V6D40_01395 [Corynebacterium sp. Q4381]|uniref:hypothetical protein n=1 Tax=Corynebacterium sp. Marseille-Q4381 TaxID=3121597 RepID=UPI002FE55254